MKKNTITILWPMPPLKGISQYLEGFVEALSHHNQVQVLSFHDMYPGFLYPWWNYRDKNKIINTEINTIVTHSINRRNPYSRIKAWLSIQWSILHMQYWIRFLAPIYITIALIAKYYKKIPIIITIHNVIPHESSKLKILIDKLVYSICDQYIVHSKDNQTQLTQLIGNKKNIHIFSHGIIIHPYEKKDKVQARNNLNLPIQKTILLFYGNIRRYKWLQYLLETLYKLIQHNNNYHLIIAGQCRENREEYQRYIDSHGLNNFITRIPEFISEEPSSLLFSASDLLVLPYSHFDAQSGVIALWLWYEIPILVSNLWWLTEIIDNKKYIFEPQDSDSMESCIIRNTNTNVDDTQYISWLKVKYSRDKIVKDYLVYLSKLLWK